MQISRSGQTDNLWAWWCRNEGLFVVVALVAGALPLAWGYFQPYFATLAFVLGVPAVLAACGRLGKV